MKEMGAGVDFMEMASVNLHCFVHPPHWVYTMSLDILIIVFIPPLGLILYSTQLSDMDSGIIVFLFKY